MSTIITADKLKFSWANSSSFQLFIDTLTINTGDKVFIQGASGCGKSTLLSLLSGVNVAGSGKLSVLGTDLASLSNSQRDQFRADHIGVIFQQFNLLPYLTTVENVVLACEFSKVRKNKALQNSPSLMQEAERLLSHLEISGNDLLHKPVNELSVGQQQRVAVARALIGSPEIIVADEPTSSLDADRCDLFINLLQQEAAACGATLLFVSHDQRLKEHFDKTLILQTEKDDDKQSQTSLLSANKPVMENNNGDV